MRYIFDMFLVLLERIFILLIIIGLSIVILLRVDNLLDTGIVEIVDEEVLASEDDLVIEEENKAPIVYKGQKSKEDLSKASDVEKVQGQSQEESMVVSFEIYEGEGPQEVGQKFQDLGLIESANWFVTMLVDLNLQDSIRPGSYDVPSDITNVELIETITVSTALEELETENPQLQEQVPKYQDQIQE